MKGGSPGRALTRLGGGTHKWEKCVKVEGCVCTYGRMSQQIIMKYAHIINTTDFIGQHS